MKPTEKSALLVMETLSTRVGLRLQGGVEDRDIETLVGQLSEEIDALGDAVESNIKLVPERLVDLAASCVVVMASLVAGTDDFSEMNEVSRPIDVENAAEKARRLMIERAAQSGIVIKTKLD